MLKAVIHGKARGIDLNGESYRWRDLFQQYEDLLTATFFGRFEYLSAQGLRDVLKILMGDIEPPIYGDMHKMHTRFWPSHFDIENQHRVEPDVILSFPKAKILIEVKLPTNGQYFDQWKNEIEGSLTERDTQEKDQVVLLAVGGVNSSWRSDAEKLINEFPQLKLEVCAVNWDKVNEGINSLVRDHGDLRDTKVYQDWLDAFGLYGINRPLRPFSELGKFNITADMRALLSFLPIDRANPISSGWHGDLGKLRTTSTINSGVIRAWK